jgi:alkylation response protein AidB-like acyl-CoA dehydrogenase
MAADDVEEAADHAVRDSALRWVKRHWDPDRSVRDWWQVVGAAGWTAPHFPVEWGGRGCPAGAMRTVRAAFEECGALMPPGGLGVLMAAPTIASHGTQEQIDRFVPDVYNGSVAWCQLFSEPGSGSDLASLTTRAVRAGDCWVISGQKVWSSMAREADYGMLIARTDFDASKHAGISWFALPLDQPGVTIRPLVEITGHSGFNEVFFDDAVVDHENLVGGENNGWAIAQSTLRFERAGIGAGGTMAAFPPPGPKGGFLDLRAGDAALQTPPETGHQVLSVPELLELARELGRHKDPVIRQSLARLVAYTRTGEWTAKRAVPAAGSAGGAGMANLGKLARTRTAKLSGEVALALLGAEGVLWNPDGRQSGRYSEAFVFSAASSIYGGTDEIQRNVIGERVLGLPREPDPYKGAAFREVLAHANEQQPR